jgi:hypothetical protein
VNDAEDEHDPIVRDHVVHDPVVADPKPVEGVRDATDRLYALSADPSRLRRILREPLEGGSDAPLRVRSQLLQRENRSG